MPLEEARCQPSGTPRWLDASISVLLCVPFFVRVCCIVKTRGVL